MDSRYATHESRYLKDSYKILDPSYMDLEDLPMFEKYTLGECSPSVFRYGISRHGINRIFYYLSKTKCKIYSHDGLVTMKMLRIFEDGHEHHYREILKTLFPNESYGHDIDCYKSLQNGFIGFSSKHDHGSMFYKITDAGRDLLKICDANKLYYRMFRWIRFKGNDIVEAMMHADLAGEESYNDLSPESMLELLKNIFDKNSLIRKIGSAYRWVTNVINAYKQNDEAYSLINSELVEKWMIENSLTNPEVNRFKVRIEKIKKKKMKNA